MLKKYEVEIREYDQVAVRAVNRRRLNHLGNLNSLRVSFFRIAKLMFMSGVASEPSSVRLALEVTANVLSLLSKLAVNENYVCLSLGCKRRYRDYEKGFYAGKLGEAISWAFIQDSLNGEPNSICDLKSFFNFHGIVPPPNSSSSDFCFISNNQLHVIEAKGSWSRSITYGLKSELRDGLSQNDSSVNILRPTHPVHKTHVTGFWMAERNEGWNSTLHYTDPEEIGGELTEENIRFLKIQY